MTQPVTHPGQINAAGDQTALYLKLYSGEVLKAFKPQCIALSLTKVRTLTKGKSFQFPMIGRSPAARYVKAGVEVVADTIDHGEITVTADELVAVPVFVSELDEVLQHFETRGEYSADAAAQLAELIDRNIFRMLAKAAFITNDAEAKAAGLTHLVNGEVHSGVIELRAANDNGDALNPAQSFVDALYRTRTQFKKLDIRDSLTCVVEPETFELLVNASGNIGNMAWLNRDVGASGTIESTSLRIAGIPIVETNHLPTTDQSAGTGEAESPGEVFPSAQNKYRGDYSRLKAIVFTKDAVVTVKLKDIATQVVPQPLKFGTILMSKMAMGHNIMRPACAVAIVEAAPSGMSARKAK